MPFFNEFGKKISHGGKEAVRKTKEMASIVSWNADITDAEARIYDLEEEIGRAVYEENFAARTKDELRSLLAMDEDEALKLSVTDWKPFAENLLKIAEDKALIADREKRIAALKGELRCPRCYKILIRGARYCPNCGLALEDLTMPEEPAPEKEAAPEAAETGEKEEP